MTAFDACCAFRGGYTHGVSLMMDAFSTTRAYASSSGVSIECGCEFCRYDTGVNSCVQFCTDGSVWNQSDIHSGDTIFGECVECGVGTISGTNATFPLSCEYCEPGRFSSKPASIECTLCDKNTFAQSLGSTECLVCPFGKQSQTGQQKCSPCDEMYMGSKHCDFPVLGIGIALGILLIFASIVALALLALEVQCSIDSSKLEDAHLSQPF